METIRAVPVQEDEGRKHMRRERDGISFYRGARSTLAGRVKKKLTEKSNFSEDELHPDILK